MTHIETWFCLACNSGEVFHMGFLGLREHGRCRDCGADQSRLVQLDPEDQILRDEEIANGILTRPGESLIDTVQAARDEDEHEAFNNDMKPR